MPAWPHSRLLIARLHRCCLPDQRRARAAEPTPATITIRRAKPLWLRSQTIACSCELLGGRLSTRRLARQDAVVTRACQKCHGAVIPEARVNSRVIAARFHVPVAAC